MAGSPEQSGPAFEPTPPLHEHPALRALVLALAAILAYLAAIDGELVWDDAAMVSAAARLSSPWAAFSRDLFDLGAAGAGAGASYWRPLVTLSFALDLRVFTAAPQFGLHLVNLLWHALAAVLVGGALARWTRADTAPARRGRVISPRGGTSRSAGSSWRRIANPRPRQPRSAPGRYSAI